MKPWSYRPLFPFLLEHELKQTTLVAHPNQGQAMRTIVDKDC